MIGKYTEIPSNFKFDREISEPCCHHQIDVFEVVMMKLLATDHRMTVVVDSRVVTQQ